jgi:hypothetical protein
MQADVGTAVMNSEIRSRIDDLVALRRRLPNGEPLQKIALTITMLKELDHSLTDLASSPTSAFVFNLGSWKARVDELPGTSFAEIENAFTLAQDLLS